MATVGVIERAAADPLGRLVKLADNALNLESNDALAQTDPETATRLREKYERARASSTGPDAQRQEALRSSGVALPGTLPEDSRRHGPVGAGNDLLEHVEVDLVEVGQVEAPDRRLVLAQAIEQLGTSGGPVG